MPQQAMNAVVSKARQESLATLPYSVAKTKQRFADGAILQFSF
jgi:hypothetical protein